MKFHNTIKNAGLLSNDPRLAFKKRVYGFYNIETILLSGRNPKPVDLLDISLHPLSSINIPETYFDSAERILIDSRLSESVLKQEKSEKNKNKFIEACLLRNWGPVKKIREYKNNNYFGDLTSLRVFWHTPMQKICNKKKYLTAELPDLLDICIYISGSRLVNLYIEQTGKEGFFALAELEGNIIAELSVNKNLPASLKPLYGLHTYFTEGAATNIPLSGHMNTDGVLEAHDDSFVYLAPENNLWEISPAEENLFLHMIGAINAGNYSSDISENYQSLCAACSRAFASGEKSSYPEGHP
ncbi:MAG TPA: hypothetical protein DC049_02420, partial [Spirochaetia bacterium]|nr:hypothetical protein [Spirochaetia bacterium]